MVFVQDKKLRMGLRKALLLAEPETALSVSAYVAGGHAYLVGWVKDESQRQALEEAARGVPGLLSLGVYLPVKPTGTEAPRSSSELELKAKVVAAITATARTERANVSVDVLGTHAVLVGVVRTTDDIQSVGRAARETSGISGVTSFLSVPLESERKRLGGILP